MVEEGKRVRESDDMNKKKNKGERSAQMQAVSAGLQDVLGMTQWRAAHPKATLREIEEAVDAQMNQLRAQLIGGVGANGRGGRVERSPARGTCEM